MPARGASALPREERLRSALEHLRAAAGPTPWQPTTNAKARVDRLRTELRWLVEWAEEENCILTSDSFTEWEPGHRGWEMSRLFMRPPTAF
jgi:hypothetical protein